MRAATRAGQVIPPDLMREDLFRNALLLANVLPGQRLDRNLRDAIHRGAAVYARQHPTYGVTGYVGAIRGYVLELVGAWAELEQGSPQRWIRLPDPEPKGQG